MEWLLFLPLLVPLFIWLHHISEIDLGREFEIEAMKAEREIFDDLARKWRDGKFATEYPGPHGPAGPQGAQGPQGIKTL